jgi:hypothetical protein
MESKGSAKSTVKVRAAAKLHLDQFCTSKHFPRSKDLSEEQFCNENFFRQFSTYLTEYANSIASKKSIMAKMLFNTFEAQRSMH